jgi:hypothetical protein
MSRFDNELVKTADNAYQMHGLSGQTTTPRQMPYDQQNTVGTDQAPGVTVAPKPVQEMRNTVADQPIGMMVQVTDLEAADPSNGAPGEIMGGPGSSAVYAEGRQMTATVNPIDESLYNVYKASREIRDAIDNQVDFDFSRLLTAANDASTVLRFATTNDDVKQVIGTVASIVLDIENDLATTSNYHQAAADLTSLEGLLENINKVAAKKCTGEGCDADAANGSSTCGPDGCKKAGSKEASKKSCSHCHGKGCDECECSCDGKGTCKACKNSKTKKATNGNQETNVVVDVRDLDDAAGVWDRQVVMSPSFTTNVQVPEEVNGEDAGYVPFYNDGAETGIVPGQEPNKQVVWPNDATNPAFVPYQQGVVAAVQASREKIYDSLNLVDRLEKMGMVSVDDRAKHLAKFEQMDSAKLAGFVAALDTFEESGARQPRSQKVASGSNRLPEMGRLTTASTVKRQDVQSDDWLMTL